MNIQHYLLGMIVAILLVASSYGAPLDGNETNITTNIYSTNPVTTLITTVTKLTTAPITTARVTSYDPISSNAPTTTSVTSTATSITPASSSSTKPVSPTTKASGRKFDGLSFLGGIILAGGLGGIIFLVVSYLRRNNQLPYSNLR